MYNTLKNYCLKGLQKVEEYLEPKRASTLEVFVNILNGLLFFAI